MNKILYWAFSLLIGLLLLLPVLQWQWKLFPRENLIGVYVERRKPILTFDTYTGTGFQTRFQNWYLQNHGLWEYLVRTSNEIDFRIFHQLGSQYGTGHTFLAGTDGSIFQSLYLRDFNGHRRSRYKDILKLTRNLKKLQRYMQSLGKAVVILISPNKLSMYPDLVPERYTAPTGDERIVDQFMRAASQVGLETFHTRPYLELVDTEDPYPLFAATAAHWNSVGACAVARMIMQIADDQHEKVFNKVECGVPVIEPKPRKVDHDLMDTINIWTPQVSYHPTPYVTASRQLVPEGRTPQVLYVGTSFVWGLLDILEPAGLYRKRDFYYYGNTNHYWRKATTKRESKRGSVRVDYRSLDWDKDVFSKDILILEANEARLHQIGFQFLGAAVREILKRKGISPEDLKKKRKETRKLRRKNELQNGSGAAESLL